MKGFSGFGNSPAKHRKDGKWTGHKHRTLLGKISGIIASKGEMNVGGDFTGDEIMSDGKPRRYTTKDYDVMGSIKRKEDRSGVHEGLFRGSKVTAERQRSGGEEKGMKLGGELKIGGKSIISTSAPRPKRAPGDGYGTNIKRTDPARGRTWKIFGHEIKPLSRKEQQKKSKTRQKKFGFTFKG